jgi:hypothetical protein
LVLRDLKFKSLPNEVISFSLFSAIPSMKRPAYYRKLRHKRLLPPFLQLIINYSLIILSFHVIWQWFPTHSLGAIDVLCVTPKGPQFYSKCLNNSQNFELCLVFTASDGFLFYHVIIIMIIIIIIILS